jgi:hypothetical protein
MNFSNKWKEGKVKIGAVDKRGNELRQFDFVMYEGEKLLIMWSHLEGNYVAQSEEHHWIGFEDLHLTEKLPDSQTDVR